MEGLPHSNRDHPGGWLWCRDRRGAARMVPRHRVVDASLLMSAVSRKEPLDGRLTHGPGVRFMSTDTSVPQPRVAGLDVSDSALLATLLREAPIGFAFFGTDLRFRRINRSLARLHGRNGPDHLGLLPSQVWPEALATRAEAAIRSVLAADQPLFEPDQPIIPPARTPDAGSSVAGGANGGGAGGGAGGEKAADGAQQAAEEPATAADPGQGQPGSGAQARHWAFSW